MKRARVCLLLASLLPVACTTTAPPTPCSLAAADRAWLEDSLAAWRVVRDDLLELPGPDRTSAVFFDAACTVFTDRIADPVDEWDSRRHGETVTLPNGDEMPAVVTSFASPIDQADKDGGVFFVMSTPSVWRAGGVDSDLGLETLMSAVLLHEMSHTVQFDTYGQRVSEIAEGDGFEELFGDRITDDLVQDLFSDDPDYTAAVEEAIELWFEAAAASDDATARRLTREALDAVADRRERFGDADHERLWAIEDLFLTLEGSGQWVAYSWLRESPPLGLGLPRYTAETEFGRRGAFWTQSEGLGMVLTLDRLDPRWKETVFGDGSRTVTELLEDALRQ